MCSATGCGSIVSRGAACCCRSSGSATAALRVSSAFESLSCSTEGEPDEVDHAEEGESLGGRRKMSASLEQPWATRCIGSRGGIRVFHRSSAIMGCAAAQQQQLPCYYCLTRSETFAYFMYRASDTLPISSIACGRHMQVVLLFCFSHFVSVHRHRRCAWPEYYELMYFYRKATACVVLRRTRAGRLYNTSTKKNRFGRYEWNTTYPVW